MLGAVGERVPPGAYLMHRLRLILVGAGGLLLLGWVGLRAFPEAEGDGAPAMGQLAPWDSTLAGDWQRVAGVPAALSSGSITALDVRGDTVYALQRNKWLVVAGDAIWGPYGSISIGAPDELTAGTGIVGTPFGVLTLDAGRFRVSHWSLDGVRGEEADVSHPTAAQTYPGFLVPTDSGAFVGVVTLQNRGAQYTILRVAGSAVPRIDTLLQDPVSSETGAGWEIPFPALAPSGTVGVLNANSWRLRQLAANGTIAFDSVRKNAPRWRTTRRQRGTLLEQATSSSGPFGRVFSASEYAPPVRGFLALDDDRWIALSADPLDRSHAELLDARGRPLARLWQEPEPEPVFAVRGALYRVRATYDTTFIERLHIHPR